MNVIQKATWLLAIAVALISCSKGEDERPEGTGECWYSVTLDGVATQPNQFGQDKIIITGAMDDEHPGKTVFTFGISQAKGSGTQQAHLYTMIHGLFNSESPSGSYPVHSFVSSSFDTPAFEKYPTYANVLSNPTEDHVEGSLAFNLVENSDQRIRMKVSGTVLRFEEVGGEVVETGTVPVEAEIVFGRQHLVEIPVNGVLIGGVNCDCREQ